MATHVPEMSRFGLELSQEKLHDDLGYVNLLREIDTPTGIRPAYLSVSMLRQWAARIPQLRLADRDELDIVRNDLALTRAQLEQVEAERDELQAQIKSYQDGFQQVLHRTPPKRQGRPPREKVAG